MTRLFNLKNLFAAALIAGTAAFAGSSASACDTYGYGYTSSYGASYVGAYDYGYDYAPPPAYQYKSVTTYVPKTISVTSWVTKYDCYGDPYRVEVVNYKTIQVPVTTLVKVAY